MLEILGAEGEDQNKWYRGFGDEIFFSGEWEGGVVGWD